MWSSDTAGLRDTRRARAHQPTHVEVDRIVPKETHMLICGCYIFRLHFRGVVQNQGVVQGFYEPLRTQLRF